MSAFDPRRDSWEPVELNAGDRIVGTVEQLPTRAAFEGHRLFLRQRGPRGGTFVVGLYATAKRGHTLLEQKLRELGVQVGDQIGVRYGGKRRTADGEREYRGYEVWLVCRRCAIEIIGGRPAREPEQQQQLDLDRWAG